MQFYRLIKPDWAKPLLDNGEPNSKFIEEFKGDDVIDGCDFSQEFLSEHNNKGYNLYWFPNCPDQNVYASGVKYLNGKHIKLFNYVFVDMDLKDKVYKSKEEFIEVLKAFPIVPTFTVDSGNGIHAYWQISDLTRDLYVYIQQGLINIFKTDESIFTVLQLMRIPCSINTKRHKDYVQSKLITDVCSNQVYTKDKFGFVLTMPQERLDKAQRHLDKLDGKLQVDLGADVNLDELPDRFIDYIHKPSNLGMYRIFTDPTRSYKDRSSADMALANILFAAGFDRKEALAVLANTQKALSHANRRSYAQGTIDKVYVDNLQRKYRTVGQRLKNPDNERQLAPQVKGTYYFDNGVLGHPWRKKEVMGLIAGPGVGKTSVVLQWIKDAIENNPDNDDIYIIFSLEMPEEQIIDRWIRLVGKDSKLADRLYVIGNEEEDGTPRNMGLQEIYDAAMEIKKGTGKNIGMMAIDHIGITARHINLERKPNFGALSESEGSYGKIRTISLNSLATQMKTLAKVLETFLIVLTQTTKDKGKGDIPIDKDGAYGISQYENIMDRIVTIWQPLQRVQSQTKLRFLAFQYVKIRDKHKDDQIQTHEPKILIYDIETGKLNMCGSTDYQEFLRLLPSAQAAREKDEKKQTSNYSIHIGLDKIQQITQALTGTNTNELAKIQPNQHAGTN